MEPKSSIGSSKLILGTIDPVSSFTFGLYVYFLIDFFLHLSQRIPGYGIVRPTLVLVLWLSFLLYTQKHKAQEIFQMEQFQKIRLLILYLVLTFLLVRWPGSALNNLPDFVKAVCFFFFTAMVVDTEKRLKVFLWVFVGCQLIRVYEPLFLHLTTGYWGSATYIGGGEFAGRLSGAPSDVINPNELGFVISTIVPFLYYLLWQGSSKGKVLFLALLPPLLFALILTMSRGAMIALLVVAWFIFKESKYKAVLLIVGFGIAVAGWSVMSDLQKDRYLSIFQEDVAGSSSVDGRFEGMKNEMILGLTTSPIFGNGLGTTSETKYHEWGRSQESHILYAELVIEIGLIGTIIFLLYLKSIYKVLKRVGNTPSANELRLDSVFRNHLGKAMIAIFWMYLVYSTNYWGLSVYYWYLFGGLAVAVVRIYGQGSSREE